MSYDVSLLDSKTKKVITFDFVHHMTGGTYILGGTNKAWLNVTYNYSIWYCKDGVFPDNIGIRVLDGMTATDSIPVLENAISVINNISEDLSEEKIKAYEKENVSGYWLPTKVNAIRPLYQLLAMAKLRPDGIWEVI